MFGRVSDVSEKHISKHDIFINICADLPWFFVLSFESSFCRLRHSTVFIGLLVYCSRSVLNSDTGVLLSNQWQQQCTGVQQTVKQNTFQSVY